MPQSLQITRYGGPEVLKLQDTPSQSLQTKEGKHSVRIQVAAAGINFADLLMRMGMYPEAPRPPFTPGYEIAGKITEVGKDVKDFHPGDRVLGACRFGGYTNEIVLSTRQIRKTPSHLSDVEAAAIPVTFMTAWTLLHEMARVRKGDRVLIQSAAGGVGIAATQIAVQAGAEVVGLVGSEKKFETVRKLGAHEMLTESDWIGMSDEKAGRFQIILDCTGGSSLRRNFRRLATSGRIVNYGVSSIMGGDRRSYLKILSTLFQTPVFTPIRLMMENKGIFGLNMLQLFADPLIDSTFAQVMENFEARRFKVIVDRTFSFAQGAEAHTYLQSRASIGKVVLV